MTSNASILDLPADGITVSVSLGKAQKWHERLAAAMEPSPSADDDLYGLRRHRRHRGGVQQESVITLPVSASVGGQDIVRSARERIETLREKAREAYALSADQARLKEAIFEANVKSGASRIMASIRLWKERLAAAERQIAGLAQASESVSLKDLEDNDVEIADRLQVAASAALSGGSTVSLTVRVFSPDEVKEQRAVARRALNDLDDSLREINGSWKVEVGISPSGAQVLGV